ncbi:MAG TPA: hypothetical protein DIW24_00010 [Bacteroidetes bacterium]|nr:hypothetical protein [Bacteroidota bacterium]HRR07447.1 hypothetical protein [Rhodothermales bacterium]
MKNVLRSLAFSAFVVLTSLSFSACDQSFYDNGYPVVNYQIPNIVLGRAEAWSRDLIANPKVFVHTGGGTLYYDARSTNNSVADAYVRNGFLYVVAGVPGSARVRVSAEDNDGEYAETEFTITVEANKAKN